MNNKIISKKMVGYWEAYFRDGKLSDKGNYKDGEKDGCWEIYWASGRLWSKGNYKDGKEVGYWERFNRDGTPWYQIFYY